MQKWKIREKVNQITWCFLYAIVSIGGIHRQFFENDFHFPVFYLWKYHKITFTLQISIIELVPFSCRTWIWLFHYGIGAIPTFASLWIWGSTSLAGLQCTVINRPICKEMSAPARCWSQSYCIPFFLCPALCWRNDQCLQKHEMHFKIQGCSVQALDLEVHKL